MPACRCIIVLIAPITELADALAKKHISSVELTQEAIARGIFGAPTYVYQDELFWGQDRLDFLDREMAK